MKALLLIAIISVTLLSCKKQVLQTKQSPLLPISSNATLKAVVTDSVGSSSVDFYKYNNCTDEIIHVTGIGEYTIERVETARYLRYTFLLNYRNLKAWGLSTGLIYNGKGGTSQRIVAIKDSVLVNDRLEVENIKTKITFVAPGSRNNLTLIATIHLVVKNQTIEIVDKEDYQFDLCR